LNKNWGKRYFTNDQVQLIQQIGFGTGANASTPTLL
jgi:hypothetical protein